MNRWLRAGLSVVLVLVVIGVTQAQDTVIYKKPTMKKEELHFGPIEEETPGGIKIKVRDGKDTKVVLVPTSEIVQVKYKVAEVDAVTLRAPFSKEERGRLAGSAKQRKQYLEEALEGYTKLVDQVGSRKEARRYM